VPSESRHWWRLIRSSKTALHDEYLVGRTGASEIRH
jgi:hypothetical protein